MAQITRNNHYVPCLYLRSWEHAPNRIWQYRLLVSNKNVPLWESCSIDNVASSINLYTYLNNEIETDEFEEWFNREIENPTRLVIDKIISGISLKQCDFDILIKYLAAQFARTPARLVRQIPFYTNKIFPIINETVHNTIQNIQNRIANNEPISLPAINENMKLIPSKVTIIKDGNNKKVLYETIAGRGMWLFEIKNIVQKTSKVLMNHNWEIIRVAHGVNWCTSDDPVICLNYYDINNFDFKGGWNQKGTEIIFPLTPNYILYTQIGCREKHYSSQEDPCFTYIVQKMIIEHAYRYIFSKSRFDSIAFCRDRIVNEKKFKMESQMWKQWYEEQNSAEKKLKSNNTGHSM